MGNEKYAVGEYERRFLLAEIPSAATDPRRLVDRYIDDTRLRLRTVERDGVMIDRKLGQKRRVVDDDPTAIMHTSVYLDDSELAVLAALPARQLVKTRWAIDVEGQQCSVNVFEEALDGLILLEADVGRPSLLDAFVAPAWAGPEVTHLEAFTGGGLAGRSFVDLAPVLSGLQIG